MRRYAGAAATIVCPLKSSPGRLCTGTAAASPTIDSGRTHRGQQDHENDLSERRRLKFLSAQRRYVESSFRNNFLPFCGDALRHEEIYKQAAAMGTVAVDNNSSSTSLSSSFLSSAFSHRRRPHPMIELSAIGNSRWSAAFRWRVSPTLSVVVQGTLRVENVVSTTKEEARYRMMAAVLLLLPNPAAVKRFLEVLEYRDVVAIDAAHRGVNVGWELVLHSEPFKAPLSHNDVEREEDDDIEAKEALRVLAEPRAARNRSGRGGTSSTSSSSTSSSEPNSSSMSHDIAMMSRSITPSSLGYRVSIQSALPAFLEESLSNDKQHIIRGTLSSRLSADMTEGVQTDENGESFTVLYTEMSTSTSPSMFVMVRDAAKHALARLATESSVLMYLRLGAATQRELSTVTSMIGVSGDLFSIGSSVQPSSSLLVQELTAESATPNDVQQQRRCDVAAVPSTTAIHFASLSNHYLRTQLLSSFDLVPSATSSTNIPLLLPSMGLFFEELEFSLEAPIIEAATSNAVFNYSGFTNAAIRPLLPFTLTSSVTKHHVAHSLSRFHSRHQFLKLEVPQIGVIDFVSRCKRETSQQRRRFHRHHPGDYHRAAEEEDAEEVNKSDAGMLSDLGVLLPSVTELSSSSSSVGSPTTYRWNDVHTLAAVTSAASVSSNNSALHRIVANRKNINAGSGERAALASSQPTLAPIKADIVGEALIGCPLSTFALPHAQDGSIVCAKAPLCLGRPYAALITSAVSTALLTEMLRTAGQMRVHLQRTTTTNFSRSPQSADMSGGSVHAETTTTMLEDVGAFDDASSSSFFLHEDRTMDIPDVILMFQVIRETLLQSRDVVPTLTVTQNVNYSVTPHLVAIGLRGEGPQQIPVTTTCVLEWPISTTTSSTTTSSGSVREESLGGKGSSGPLPTGHDSGSSSQAMQYLRIERSSASTTTSDSGSPKNLLRPGAGPLPLLIDCVCALYRLIVTLTEHRFRDVSKSKSRYSSRELRQSRDAIVAAAMEFLERQSPRADGVPPGATTNSQEKRLQVLKRHAILQSAIDPTTSVIATPTMIAHDVTRKQKFLDFLMFHWFGAAPQEKYFWIKKNELNEASGLSHTKQPQQTADGIGPVTKSSPALINSAAAGVDQTNRLAMYRGQLIYDVLGNRVLMAAVHAKTPLDAHRALLDSATLLNAPSSSGTTDQRWGNRSRKNRTFQRNNAKLPELLDNPTNSTTTASVPGTPVAFLPEPTQKYSLLMSNGPLLSPLTFYLQALAKLGYRAQLLSTAAATVAFVIFRSVGPKLSTAPEQKLDEALSIEKAFCAATTADRIKRLKEAGVVASCEIRPYNVNDSVVSSDQDSNAGSGGAAEDWIKILEDACREAVTIVCPHPKNSYLYGTPANPALPKKAQQIIFDARNCSPCLPRDDFPLVFDAMFYTPTNLLAEALQGLCSKYDAHYETCSITERPNTFIGGRAAPSDDSFSKSSVGFRCVLTIASVGGLTLPMPKYAYAQQQRGGGDFVIGVGTGYSKTQAWRAAAVAALKRHFPQLLEQKNALAELSDTLTTSSLGPSIRLELGFGLGMPNFIFGSRFVRQDIASDEAPRRRFESVCRVATSSKSRSDVSPHATNDETVDGDSPSASFWFETTAETDGVAFVKAVRELQTRWKVAVAEHVQVAAAATAEQHPMFHRWDMTSNYTKSFLHAHFGALGVALKGKLRLSLNKSPQSDDDSANTMSSDVVGSDNGLAKDLCVTIEMMDEHNHLRAAVLHPNGNVLSTEASALVQSLGKSGSAKGARVLPGGTMFVELFALLRHHIRLRCDVLVRESEMPLLRDAIQGRMQTEGTSFRFSAERRVQCILRALLGLQVEVVVGNSHDDTDDDSVTESKRLLFGGSPPSVLPLYRPFRATVFVYLPIAGEAEFLALRWHEQYQRQVDRDADLTSLHRQQHAADPSQQAAWGATKNVTHKKMKKANAMKHIPIVSSRQVPPRKPKFLDHEAPERARVALFTASDESSQRAALEKLLRLTEQFTESCGVWN